MNTSDIVALMADEERALVSLLALCRPADVDAANAEVARRITLFGERWRETPHWRPTMTVRAAAIRSVAHDAAQGVFP